MRTTTISLGLAAMLVLVAYLLGTIVSDISTRPAPTVMVTVTCTPVPDDTDQPLPPGLVACGR